MEQTASDTKYLRLLPDMRRRIEEQGESMVNTFSQLSRNLFRLLMALVIFLALIVVIVLLRDSTKDFQATANGISITQSRPFLEPGR